MFRVKSTPKRLEQTCFQQKIYVQRLLKRHFTQFKARSNQRRVLGTFEMNAWREAIRLGLAAANQRVLLVGYK